MQHTQSTPTFKTFSNDYNYRMFSVVMMIGPVHFASVRFISSLSVHSFYVLGVAGDLLCQKEEWRQHSAKCEDHTCNWAGRVSDIFWGLAHSVLLCVKYLSSNWVTIPDDCDHMPLFCFPVVLICIFSIHRKIRHYVSINWPLNDNNKVRRISTYCQFKKASSQLTLERNFLAI